MAGDRELLNQLRALDSQQSNPRAELEQLRALESQSIQQPQEPQEQGFLQSVGDFFTGADRETRATQDLPELTQGGLLFGEDEGARARSALAISTATNPQEIAQILTSNFPNIGIISDEKQNLIAVNNKTGKKVVINKPGLSQIDIMQGLGLASAFALGPTSGALKVAAGAGGVSAGLEGLQALGGGEFNIEQVAIDAVTAGVLDKALDVAKATGRKIGDVLKEQGINPKQILDKVRNKQPDPSKFDKKRTDFKSPFAQTSKKDAIAELEKARANPDLGPEDIARIERAKPVTQLTRAQATKDFAASEAEETLKKSVSPEGQVARDFADSQQRDLQEAATKFTDRFGGSGRLSEARGELVEVTAREKGGQIQTALRDVKEKTRQEVSALYTRASETAGEAIPLNNAQLVDIADEAIVNLPVSDATEKTMNTALAKFGLIGDSVTQSSRNKFKVTDGTDVITITGDVTPLNLANAAEFRIALNKAVGDDRTGAAKGVVNHLDSEIERVIKEGADSGRSRAFKTASDAFAAKKVTFDAKDIVEDLVKFKKGTKTDFVDPESVITKIAKGDKSVTNIRKVKQILLGDKTPESARAWKSIQAETVGDIFSQSINKDTLAISGLRLNSAMKKFKPEALKELLGPKSYKDLLDLQKTIGDVTIPPPGTTNPSGTFTKALAMFERLGNFAGGGRINFGSLGVDTVRKGSELAGRKKALDGIINTKIKTLKKANPRMSVKALKRAAKTLAFLEIRELDKQENK